MKNLQLLTWLTQLGLSTAVPLAGFVLLAVWLKNRFGLGVWVIFAGLALGLFCAVTGFYKNLKILGEMTEDKRQEKPPISFSEHE